MITIPTLGFLRHVGAGRELRIAGVTLLARSDPRAEWLMVPADWLHGPLAWTLLAWIVGHLTMVLLHRFRWKDDVLARMTGRSPRPR